MAIKTAAQLAAKCKDVAENHKTLYVLGCFGSPMTASNKKVYTTQHCAAFNGRADRKPKIQAATADTFGFDCVCMIKGLLWGWDGNTSKTYGGAAYASNGVPDIDADFMIQACKDVSTDFSKIEIGEALGMKGHIGVYIGNGLAVECTYRWKDGVQITAVHNIGKKAGYNGRSWTKHGKLPYVTYDGKAETQPTTENTEATEKKADYTLGMRVLREGCKGEDVRALQYLLIANDCSCGDHGPDGSYGPATKKAVKKYQGKKGLEKDGVAGPKTMASLLGV